MATTTKKGSKKTKAKPRRGAVKTSPAKQAQTIAELRKQLAQSLQRENATAKKLQERNRQLAEALQQQTATGQILRVIASSPTEIQPVLDTIAENAAKICNSSDAVIRVVEGNVLRTAASYGPLTGESGWGPISIDRGNIPGRAIVDRQTIHIPDLAEVPEDELRSRFARRLGVRTILGTPLLREGVPIGTISIRR